MKRRLQAGITALTATGFAILAGVLTAAPASAHPLGNFTVNHYDGIIVSDSGFRLDSVMDLAEIPTAQNRAAWDPDGNGASSPTEAAAYARSSCGGLAGQLVLTVDGRSEPLTVGRATASFPVGAAGLPTTRIECALQTPIRLSRQVRVDFRDDADQGRIGWREIVVIGDGATVSGSQPSGSQLPGHSISRRLTSYPQDLLASPLTQTRVGFQVSPGGRAAQTESSGPVSALLPQRVDRLSQSFTGLVTKRDLGLPALALALLLAVLLGAGHAFLPGHGKTIMAAYIVGRRGTVGDAVVVGATVTATHTVGVLVLGVLVSVSTALAPEQIVRSLSLISGLLVSAVGLFLLNAVRRRRARSISSDDSAQHTRLPIPALAGHQHGSHEPHGQEHHSHEPHGQEHHSHEHHGHEHHGHPHAGLGLGEHRHAHGSDERFGRRGLLGIGVAGGLVPSPSALLVLLAAFGLGRPVYGIVLVLCYGLGMSLALTFAGLALVRLRDRWERLVSTRGYHRLERLGAAMPVITATVIALTGLTLSVQAAGQLL